MRACPFGGSDDPRIRDKGKFTTIFVILFLQSSSQKNNAMVGSGKMVFKKPERVTGFFSLRSRHFLYGDNS